MDGNELERVRLRELLDALTDELGAPDEQMVADAMARLTGHRQASAGPTVNG